MVVDDQIGNLGSRQETNRCQTWSGISHHNPRRTHTGGTETRLSGINDMHVSRRYEVGSTPQDNSPMIPTTVLGTTSTQQYQDVPSFVHASAIPHAVSTCIN